MTTPEIRPVPSAVYAPGTRVLCRDAEWLVTRVESAGGGHSTLHCVGTDDLVRGHESRFLTQLDAVEPVDPRATRLVPDTSSGYRMARLFLEAQLRQVPATGVEPDLDGLGVFEPMPFQIDAVRHALGRLRPRLLLADDVGLGKTIQVGMILTELARRGRGKRILVLTKKSMLKQFQAELWNRFAIPLVRLDSAGIAKLRLRIPANKNPFEVYQRIIISIDTLKNVAAYRHFLERTRWDAVVIDEAHNVAGASVPERHLSHRLARLLARTTDSLLLTTATPHNGKRDTFGRLISLLDPSTMPDPEMKEWNADDIKEFFLMRFKEDVRDQLGSNLPDRLVVPQERTTTRATQAEERVYSVLADLRKAVAGKKGWSGRGLLQYGLYKAFLSSPEACRQTVERRLKNLGTAASKSPAQKLDALETQHLERLLDTLDGLTALHTSRFQLFLEQLEGIGWNGKKGSPRILVFTESRPTQDALAGLLARHFKVKYSERSEDQAKQAIATIHGSHPDVHLMATVESFSTGNSPMRLLIATDVASEGINLHHECHHVIHYDLPWSIITLIQRNGRVDRFGQSEPPELRYLLVETEQGLLDGDRAIFERLIAKVEEINQARCQGESVLKLYDAEAEERWIAEHGVLTGNADVLEKPAEEATFNEAAWLEETLGGARLADDDPLMAELLGETPDAKNDDDDGLMQGRARLMTDRDFLVEGYRYLANLENAKQDGSYLPLQEEGPLLILNAPSDLCRRLGAESHGGVIFGATAIPAEAWPEHGQFRLTAESQRVERAIKAARTDSGYWSRELLCSEQHPILQWLTERLLMLMKRGEAPIITSKKLQKGELCFFCLGQVLSEAGLPLIVDTHAISILRRGANAIHRPLAEAVELIDFKALVNTGVPPQAQAAELLLRAVIPASIDRLQKLQDSYFRRVKKDLLPEERRLRDWLRRRRERLEAQLDKLSKSSPKAEKIRQELRDIEADFKDRRENWQRNYFRPAKRPNTQVVMVVEGIA
jgi:ERCC4-related helicase